jgi:hypothetical protein
MNNLRTAKKNFLQAFKILFAQNIDPQVDSPNIIIEPVEPLLQKAVDQLKKLDPNYFKGVRKIVVKDESVYGHVESGPGKDPTIIYLNLPRIKREITQQAKSANPNAPNNVIDDAIVKALADTIAHERGHIGTYAPGKDFSGFGGESEAEAEARRISEKL